MKIYDISQEVFSCVVFPGDPAPKKNTVCSIDSGAVCNLTEFSMCAHNGTHIDAPYHFLNDGKSVDEIPLEKFTGYAFVADHEGLVSAEDAENILKKAAAANRESVKRILIKGKSTVSESAARVFAKEKIFFWVTSLKPSVQKMRRWLFIKYFSAKKWFCLRVFVSNTFPRVRMF
jgi:arylformamidase